MACANGVFLSKKDRMLLSRKVRRITEDFTIAPPYNFICRHPVSLASKFLSRRSTFCLGVQEVLLTKRASGGNLTRHIKKVDGDLSVAVNFKLTTAVDCPMALIKTLPGQMMIRSIKRK